MPNTYERTHIHDQSFDEERSFYGLSHADIDHVRFAGPADGESALKECTDLRIRDSLFELRYPLWHVAGLEMRNALLTDGCRAALWYTRDALLEDSRLLGIKALRECDNVVIRGCEIVSQEFGWKSRDVVVENSSINSEYAFLSGRNLRLENCTFSGKYSFQYVENLTIEGGTFDTKDAFWHATNVTVRNATLKGEYLGWYSQGLTLEHCRIEGTQPLVHCRDLTLIDCEMVGCDLAFEGSDVRATVRGHVDSIRDPRSGRIEVGSVGEVVHDTIAGCGAQIVVGSAQLDDTTATTEGACPYPHAAWRAKAEYQPSLERGKLMYPYIECSAGAKKGKVYDGYDSHEEASPRNRRRTGKSAARRLHDACARR